MTGSLIKAFLSVVVLFAAGPKPKVKEYIRQVRLADKFVYAAKDHTGKKMDCLEIISNPEGGFIGVYHTLVKDTLRVNLASSSDLIHWRWERELAGSNTGPASQPAIGLTKEGAFVVAWEQEPKNHLKFSYFNSWKDLKNGVVAKKYSAPMTLSGCAEGTPNIYAASKERVAVGFHYYANCDVDRQASGSTDWVSWKAKAEPGIDGAVSRWGVKGNIGDRSGIVNYEGFRFSLIEGQGVKGDFGSWRTYLYDHQTGEAERLDIETHKGSRAAANPTCQIVEIDGAKALLITLFIPFELAAPGEAGELIYYKKI